MSTILKFPSKPKPSDQVNEIVRLANELNKQVTAPLGNLMLHNAPADHFAKHDLDQAMTLINLAWEKLLNARDRLRNASSN